MVSSVGKALGGRHGRHPDTLVPGGPEIDFGVQTDDLILAGEAKWRFRLPPPRA